MQAPPLYILRHGQTEWNAEHRFQGSLDSPLTDLGRAQARDQGAILKDCDLEAFSAVCSPSGRAFHTASIALDGCFDQIHTDPRLMEIGIGRWEGKLRHQIAEGHVVNESEESALELYERAPEGEGFSALKLRCEAFLEDLQGPSVIVTHGVTSRMLRLVVLGRGIDEIGQLPGGQGVVFHLENGVQRKLSIRA